MLCYSKLIGYAILEPRTKLRKNLVSYFKNNGITTLKRHMNVDHGLIVKKIKEKMNNMKSPLERQPLKKRPIMTTSAISNFFGAIDLYKKDNVHQKDFEENLSLLISKNHLLIQFIENIWLKCLIMQLYLVFFSFPKNRSIMKCYKFG
jgi:hypothetical protein